MSAKDHWEAVYRRTAPDALSWYRAHLEISLELIMRAASSSSTAILDVGGGESTLVDDLAASGFETLTVLDISSMALEVTKSRLGNLAERVCWIAGDVTTVSLPRHSIDIWHDRAVFHFLTGTEERAAYVRNMLSCVRPGGEVIIGVFGPESPRRCSGLPIVRYDAEALRREFGDSFMLLETREELHVTPRGAVQQFVYCHFRVMPAGNAQNARLAAL
jgi:ubiquinone/menaquinone biosynthesis C-methylase UbiE